MDRDFIQKQIIDLQNARTATEITEKAIFFTRILEQNEKLTEQLDTITFPLELQCGDLTNYIGYGQAETEKLVAISFGKLTEKGKYAGENMTKDKTSVPLFIAYFDKIESLEVLEKLVNIGKARLAELEAQDDRD